MADTVEIGEKVHLQASAFFQDSNSCIKVLQSLRIKAALPPSL